MVFFKWNGQCSISQISEGGTSGNAQGKGHIGRRSWVTEINHNESKQGLWMDCVMKFSEASKLTD